MFSSQQSYHTAKLIQTVEQTYNADAKEESRLDGIPMNGEAHIKWVYTKPITAAISSQFKALFTWT